MVERPFRPESGFAYLYDYSLGAQKYPFYLTSVGHYLCGEGFYTKRDGRSDYQLIHTLSGSAYCTVGGESHALMPGSFVLIDCEKLHEYGVSGSEWTYEYIHFTGEGMRAYTETLIDKTRILRPAETALLNAYFHILESRQMGNDEASYAYACAVIALFLSAMVEEVYRQTPTDPAQAYTDRNAGIEPALHYIQAHYMENITLDDLLSVTYLSKYHFCRKFNRVTGYPPYQYITRVRLGKAMSLLRSTDDSVSLISAKCGFANSGQCIKQFAKYIGQTPGAIRKNQEREKRERM